MKIGLVRRGYSSTGGAENYLCRLADALEKVGHEPLLLTSRDWPRERWPAHREFVPIDATRPIPFADRVALLAKRHRCDRLFSLERIWECDCYRAGDGVHRAWLARRTRMEAWWRPWFRFANLKHRQLCALEDHLFGHGARSGAKTIIANSQLVRDEIVRLFGVLPEHRIRVVYNGLPAADLRLVSPEERASSRQALGLAAEVYTILFAGTGWERKGLSHALRAVARLPVGLNPLLLVAGRGTPAPYLRGLPEETRKRVRFLGPVKEMRALYAAADVFVAPTLYDPFSNACLEAAASGLPVLTTDANGFAEVIEPDVQGNVFTPDDQRTGEKLAELLTAWAAQSRREAARPLCHAGVGSFTIEKNVEETLNILLH